MRSGQSGKRGKDPFACEFERVKRAVKAGRLEEAFQLLKEMEQKSLFPMDRRYEL